MHKKRLIKLQNSSKKFKKYTNKCLTFIEKGYIIGVRWVISGSLQLNRKHVKQVWRRRSIRSGDDPRLDWYSFDIGLKNIPWRTTNNFMLLGVRLFLFSFPLLMKKWWNFLKMWAERQKNLLLYGVGIFNTPKMSTTKFVVDCLKKGCYNNFGSKAFVGASSRQSVWDK